MSFTLLPTKFKTACLFSIKRLRSIQKSIAKKPKKKLWMEKILCDLNSIRDFIIHFFFYVFSFHFTQYSSLNSQKRLIHWLHLTIFYVASLFHGSLLVFNINFFCSHYLCESLLSFSHFLSQSSVAFSFSLYSVLGFNATEMIVNFVLCFNFRKLLLNACNLFSNAIDWTLAKISQQFICCIPQSNEAEHFLFVLADRFELDVFQNTDIIKTTMTTPN